MDQPNLPLAPGPQTQRRGRGRPKGSGNKRALDLARYVEARFQGMTPGQQMAEMAMISAKDIRDAPRLADELGLFPLDERGNRVDPKTLPKLMLANAVKAAQLAVALGCDRKEAWLLLQRMQGDLLPFVHQRLPQAPEKKGGQVNTAFLLPENAGAGGPLDLFEDGEPPLENVEEIPGDDA
jgi:hypothetical protein